MVDGIEAVPMNQWEPPPIGGSEQPVSPTSAPGSATEPPLRSRSGRGRDVRLVVTGVAAVLLAWFALVNLQSVRIHFWLTSAHAPLILVIVISGALGALVPGVWALVTRRRRASGRS